MLESIRCVDDELRTGFLFSSSEKVLVANRDGIHFPFINDNLYFYEVLYRVENFLINLL